MRTAIFVLVAGLVFPSAGILAADPSKGWDFTGRTQASAVVEVRAQVTGPLTGVAVKEGAAVKKGDLLAEILSRSYQLDLDVAQARRDRKPIDPERTGRERHLTGELPVDVDVSARRQRRRHAVAQSPGRAALRQQSR